MRLAALPNFVGEEWQHRLKHARIERAGGVVIHVNRQLNAGRHCYVSVFGVTHVPVLSRVFLALANPDSNHESMNRDELRHVMLLAPGNVRFNQV